MGIEEFVLDMARKEAYKEGYLEVQIAVTKNLLALNDFDIAKIAQLVDVTESFVLNVKKDLGK